MLETLLKIDEKLFLYLNGKNPPLLDPVMYLASDKFFWLPLYLFIAFLLLKHHRKQSIWIFISIGALIAISDQISSHLIKNTLVQRLRPSHEPALNGLIHLSEAGPGGKFGFISSHAANAFGMATFMIFLLPKRYNGLKYLLGFWAILVSYSRIYNGVHYPADVIVAAFLGILLGWLIFKLYQKNIPLVAKLR